MNPRVEEVVCIDATKLRVTFKNGIKKLFDVGPYFKYPIFEELKEESFFKKARVVNGTVAWSEIIDFDPDTLYIEGVLEESPKPLMK